MSFQIAKAELRNLFYSPVAWFLAIAFLVQCAWVYTNGMYPNVKMQEAMLANDPSFKNWGPYFLTYLFFIQSGGIFTVVLSNLYLFVPLLTMGLMTREVNTGTIKLLYSSPVKLRQVVAGKYLAIMLYNLLLVGIIGIFMVSGFFAIQSADYHLLLSAALGFYLLTCAYTAIGLFVSSLTGYQILSAIGTFIIIFILTRIGGLWQKIDVVRDLTYFMHLQGRTEKMLKGLITSKDLIYFMMVVCMFLGFTLIRLRSQRESKPWYVIVARSFFVVAVTLLTGYFASLPAFTKYWDITANQNNTIHTSTQAILREMSDEPLEVTLYTNLLGSEATYGFTEARNSYLTTLWEQYQRFKVNIRYKYVYYYYYDKDIDQGQMAGMIPNKTNLEMAREIAKGYREKFSQFVSYDELKKSGIDLDFEGHRLVMQLKYKGRTEWLRTYKVPAPFPAMINTVWPQENNMAAALKRLVHPELIPNIVFTTGNLERSIIQKSERDYLYSTIDKGASDAPINLGFEFDTVALDHQEIPDNTTVLIIADPKTEFSEIKLNKIKKYIDKGGNLMMMGEPGKQYILKPLLDQLGVSMLDGNLVEPTYNEQPNMVMALYTATALNLAAEPLFVNQGRLMRSGYRYDTVKMLMPGVTALSYKDSSGFVKKPLTVTAANRTWIKKGKLVTDSAAVVYNPQEGDVMGSFPTSLQLSRQIGNKQQRIALFGDADYVSNLRILNGGFINRALYHWLDYEEFPIYSPRPDPADNLFTASSGTVKMQKIVYVWALPGILMIAAIVLLVRRKRK